MMNEEYIGRTVGQYRIEAVLGAGGMGQVFRGVHQLLDRPAAIKVMLPSFAARPDFRARFLQEAKAAAALHHPNIVEIYDYGDDNGLLYMVMEYMGDGHSVLCSSGRERSVYRCRKCSCWASRLPRV